MNARGNTNVVAQVGLTWSLGVIFCLTFFCTPLRADSWPMYRHDVARSGITSESLSVPLVLSWIHRARHEPRPAWGDPKPVPVEDILELRRVHFDDVFQLVSGSGRVFFGSSADHKVYCLDAGTGETVWSVITGGPIRLAPTLADDKLYVGSDDGTIYCFHASDGTEAWQFRAAPAERRVLGHGKMISVWPSRTGVLVDDGVAYFAAGVFPAEGVFLYAVKADDATVLWKNDATGEKPQSRISPQGYLLASKSKLYVPMGRVSPAALDRASGRLLYETSFGKQVGGSYALLAGDDVFTGTEEIVGFDQETRDRFAAFPGRRILVTDQTFYLATNTELVALDRQNKSTRWKVSCQAADELILAGDTLFAGGPNLVSAVSTADGTIVWQADVEGTAKGLAVADGRLLVSTDKGQIYCFVPGEDPAGKATEAAAPASKPATEPAAETAPYATAADAIVKESGIRRGHCLVVGCGTGQLALELAKRTELMVHAVSDDPETVLAARQRIDAAGLYGARVTVECWPFDAIEYSDYFANLVVSEAAMVSGRWPVEWAAIARFVKPCGGTIVVGSPEGMEPESSDQIRIHGLSPQFTVWPAVDRGGNWIKIVRGELPGSGNWTQQYANAGNTACGDDQMVRGPLSLLWFGDPGPGSMMNRHRRAASPVSFGDRMFIQGENTVMAYDIYNGLQLWRRDIPGATRPNASHDGGNLAVNEMGLFVAVGSQCLRLDLDTGETLTTYAVPPVTGNFQRWGYVAIAGPLLFGSRAAGAGQSDALFAFDIESGERCWNFEGKRLLHNAVAIGDERIFLVQSTVSKDQRRQVLDQLKIPEDQTKPESPIIRVVVALDSRTGELLWEKPMDLTHCGSVVSAMYQNGALVLFGVYLDGHYWKQFFAGEFDSRRVTVLQGTDGEELWSRPVGYRVRPLIIGETLHAEPWAFDLMTGENKTRLNPITGVEEKWQFARPGHHCGCPSASENCLFFRSWNLGYYDLTGDYGTVHFAGQRPGCWINFIPSGGLVLMPEASTGCMCDFPTMGTVVFQPVNEQKAWAWYGMSGSVTPVKHLAMNLGAAGDRRDSEGQLWLGYPRPSGSLVLKHVVDTTFYRGGRFNQQNSSFLDIGDTDQPWIFASAAGGVRKMVIPLLEPGDGTARYRVRMLFSDPENEEAGRRQFDVKLQGEVVAEAFDIVAQADGANRAVVKEIEGIDVEGDLVIELVAADPKAPIDALPLLNGIEIIRDQFVGPGCVVPDLLLNEKRPEQTAEIQLANLEDAPLAVSLQFSAPEGITIDTVESRVELQPGTRQKVAATVRVAAGTPVGKHTVEVRLLGDDEGVLLQRTMLVEHLGPRDRMICQASEDAHVTGRYPDRNQSTGAVMLIDGGSQQMSDRDHSIGLIRFPLDLPGKPVSVRLRIVDAGNPSRDAGRICLVDEPWDSTKVTYKTRPVIGRELARLGRVSEHQVVEVPLNIDLNGRTEVCVAIDPTSTDGIDFLTREGGTPPELIIEYE